MKSVMKKILVLLMALVLLFGITACREETPANALWADARYTEDTSLGEGAKSFTLEVTAGERTVVFSVKTDAKTVGDALLALGLLEGEEGPYGMYVKRVNGILADYDVDGTYWSFNIGGEYAMTGVDMTEITDGGAYALVRTK